MTEMHIGAEQFRRQLTDLLNRVSYGNEHVIIERHGTPLAAMIPFHLYEALVAAGIPDKLATAARSTAAEGDLAAQIEAILAGNQQPESTGTAVAESVRMLQESAQAYYAATPFTTPFATPWTESTFTLEEAAMYLKLPIDAVAQQADQGVLPGRKINNTWRFLRTAIDHWLRNSDGRQALLQQVGIFAQDEALAELRRQIYAERGRSETETEQATAED